MWFIQSLRSPSILIEPFATFDAHTVSWSRLR
jgi:hypothetical protein